MKILKTGSTLAWICRVAKKAKQKVIALTITQILQGLAAVAKTLFLGQAVNHIVSGNRKGFVYSLIIFSLLVAFQISLGALNRYLTEAALAEAENHFKSRLFNTLLSGSYAQITRTHSGEWMNRLTSDTVVVSNAFVKTIPDFIGLLVRLIAALAAILWIEPRLILFMFAGGLALIILTRIFRKIMKNLHKGIQEADGRLRVFLSERLASLLIIRTFVQEEKTSALANEFMQDHRKARMKRNHFLNVFYSGYSIGINSVYILGIVFCGLGILEGSMTYGSLVSLLQLLEQVQGPFANITGFFPQYYAMIASAERLIEVELIEKEISDNPDFSPESFYEKEFCAMGLDKVSFTYEPPFETNDEEVNMPVIFNKLNLEIKKGEHVAFTGPSGCGKSTVLKLLMSLYPPDSGEAYILSKDGKIILNAGLRKLFAYVPQGNQLLTGTIRETIAFGDKEAMKNEDKMQFALKIACADSFVNELENGLDTMLGERGTGLSEGQMQRIAIARAIFSDRPILLLDEATSALDETTANKMLNNLKTMTDKTVVLVTHRTKAISTFTKEVCFSKDGVRNKNY